MLVDTIPQSMVEAYRKNESKNIPDWARRFFLSPESLSSAEMIHATKFASLYPDTFKIYSRFSKGESFDFEPFVDKSTGLQVPGFFKMSPNFVDVLLKKDMFILPTGNGYSKMTVTGTADSIAEVQEHIKYLVNGDGEDTHYIRLGLLNKDFVVRISEHNSFSSPLFDILYHVGEWGKNLRKSSNFANNTDKMKSIRTLRQLGGAEEEDRIERMYRFMDESLHWRHQNFPLFEEKKIESERYLKAYANYQKTHQSYLVFEVLVLNSKA